MPAREKARKSIMTSVVLNDTVMSHRLSDQRDGVWHVQAINCVTRYNTVLVLTAAMNDGQDRRSRVAVSRTAGNTQILPAARLVAPPRGDEKRKHVRRIINQPTKTRPSN